MPTNRRRAGREPAYGQRELFAGGADEPSTASGSAESNASVSGDESSANSARDAVVGPETSEPRRMLDEGPAPGRDNGPESSAEPKPAQPPSLEGSSVWVVDAHSLIYQVFFALPEISGPAGQPVGAVHGFIRDVLQLLETKRPDYLLCAFDGPGKTFRHQVFEEYKMDREAMPDDLRLQIPNILRMLEALGVPALVVEGYEADDLLATVAAQTEKLGGHCYLVTGDKDCRQLISDRVKLYNIRKDQIIDEAVLMDDWSVRPDQVVDFQAMWGDSVDNIPGIPGIGKKTAGELLATYESLEGIIQNADQIKARRRRENILAYSEQARRSRELVRLRRDVPLDIDWEAARVGGVDRQRITQLCQEFGFRRLAEQLDTLTVQDAPAVWDARYKTVTSLEQLEQIVQQMSQQVRISLDTETTSTNPRRAELVGYSFAWKEGEAFYVPVQAPAGEVPLDAGSVRDVLRPVLEDPDIEKVGQNLKYDVIVLRGEGIQLQGALFDTMLADYLLDPGERNHSVDDLAKRYLNHTTIKIHQLIGTGKKQKRMNQVPVDQVTPYAGEDADVPLRLYPILSKRLETERLTPLFTDLEVPLARVLAEMEYHGIRVDVPRLRELSDRFGRRLEELQAEIYQLAGEPFNIDSRLQLAAVLFDKLKLPVGKRKKTGPSTDVEVLTTLAAEHPLPAKIIEYRENAKLKSTYVDALPELVHPGTGRIHTSFQQAVTATGRLSSTEPNLQNIPIRTKAGREIRSAFRAGFDDWLLLAADYSQIELRVLAHYSGDTALREAFHQDHDIHALVASSIYGVPLEQVTGDMRRGAKAVNFGVIYGQSPFGLAKSLQIPKEEAAAFIDAYFARYPGVDEFIKNTLAECRKKGYVSTALGRRRAVQGVRDSSKRGDSRNRNLPERIAINTVIQGSAADLIKQAMIRVHRRIQRESLQARMLLQIHDELIFEVPSQQRANVAASIVQEMTAVGDLDVPLKVDVKAGPDWAACEPV